MNSSKIVRKNESHARATPAMTTEILERIVKFSAQKRVGGPKALQGSVSFKFMDPPSVTLPRGLFRRRSPKSEEVREERVAWLVGSLLNQPAGSLYIDRDGNGYVVTSFGVPRIPTDVTLLTQEELSNMNYSQLEEIRKTLRR